MTRFFGYFIPEAHRDQKDEFTRHASLLASANEANDPAVVRCIAPLTFVQDGVHIGIAGRAIWQGRTLETENSTTSLASIVERYQEVGVRVLDQLHGPFALAILAPKRDEALLAIDRMGVERLTYTSESRVLIYGDSANDVAAFSGVYGQISNQALYDFLFMHMVPAPKTVYQGVYKLPPATALLFQHGQTHLERYWTPRYAYARPEEFPSLKKSLHAGLTTAVSDSGLDQATGAFLSGGLDSSSVAGVLADLTDGPARTFTVGFGEDEYDEFQFARRVNAHFGCQGFEYQMTPGDIVDAFPRIAAAYDEPFGNSSAAPTYFCAKLASENNVRHLLAGDGGDELFGGNTRYVRQWVFDLYFRLPKGLRSSLIEPITRTIQPESRIIPFRKARSYVDQALIPLPERLESWNFMYREGGEHMLDNGFAASIDRHGPMRIMQSVWDDAPSENLLERMLWYDWRFTLADNDLRKVGMMCNLAGVRVSYPMLHPAVVDLSTRVPPSMKIKGTQLRSFFKRAMADFLPNEIIRKKKHGFGMPFGLWLKTDKALGDLIYSHLTDLKGRRIIDAAFIDNLIAQHRDGHDSYFGYAIWDLAMLEAWMAHHVDHRS